MQITCEITGITVEAKQTPKGNPKLPMGWKWRGKKAYSKEAWHSLYCLRAITVPIVSPVIEGKKNPEAMRVAWNLLNDQLKDAWQKSTQAANWAAKRLWSNDVTRQQTDGKCPKMEPLYLYGERDWTGWSQSAGAVIRTIEASYRKKRYEIVWTGSAGVPNVRYPYPYPIHNASWGIEQTKGGEVHFDCRLPSGRVTVRLKTGDKGGKYRLNALCHLVENPDLRGEAAIIKKIDGTVMVKIVGWFPKTIRELSGELWVRTSSSHLFTLFNEQSHAREILKQRSFGYHWNDGWSASIDVQEVTPAEAKVLRKNTVGFSGYDWMVSSIVDYGSIMDTDQLKAWYTAKQAEKAGAK